MEKWQFALITSVGEQGGKTYKMDNNDYARLLDARDTMCEFCKDDPCNCACCKVASIVNDAEVEENEK